MKKAGIIKLHNKKSNVFIVANLSRKAVIPCAERLIALLKKHKIGIAMDLSARETFAEAEVEFVSAKDGFAAADMIFVIGGDGTILRAAKTALIYDKPILGINAGRLGFLSDIEADDLSVIEKLFTEGCKIEKRSVLKVTVGEKSMYAINDVFVTYCEPGKTAELFVECGEHEVCRYRADGIVLATPDGSTAYSMSAGGPIIDTTFDAIVMTPVCPHSLISRSIVFSADKIIRVGSSFNGDEEKIDVIVDGEKMFCIKKGDRVTAKVSDKYIKFINISGRGFYEVLNQKIIGRI